MRKPLAGAAVKISDYAVNVTRPQRLFRFRPDSVTSFSARSGDTQIVLVA